MPPVRAVIFDLDDTLLDHRGSTRAALTAWLSGTGNAVDPALVQAWFALESEHFDGWRAGLITFEEQRRRRLRDFLPLVGRPVGADAELDQIFTGYLDQYEKAWYAFADVQPTFDHLAELGLVVAVLTNGTVAQQNAKITALGLQDQLAAVITSEELGIAKPAPEAYRSVCRRIGVQPAEALHVGDRHDLDVVAAREAGLQALHLDRDQRHHEPPDGRITSLEELPGRLRH